MDENDDWRARRAAQLAGTPFERPAGTPDDRTLPIRQPRAGDETPSGWQGNAPAAGIAPKPAPPRVVRTAVKPVWWIVSGLGAVTVATLVWLGAGSDSIESRKSPAKVELAVAAPSTPAPVVSAAAPPDVPPQPETSAPVAAAPATPQPTQPPPVATSLRPEKTRPPRQKSAQTRPEKRPQSAAGRDDGSRLSCRSAVLSAVETAICNNSSLVAADRQERRLYTAVLNAGDRRYAIKADKAQANFLKRRDRCKTDACIAKTYGKQNAKLAKWLVKIDARRARAAENALPVCIKSQTPSPQTCRSSRAFALARLFD